jgi:hypothetical protein
MRYEVSFYKAGSDEKEPIGLIRGMQYFTFGDMLQCGTLKHQS